MSAPKHLLLFHIINKIYMFTRKEKKWLETNETNSKKLRI